MRLLIFIILLLPTLAIASVSISHTYVKSNTPKDTFFINPNSSVGGHKTIISYSNSIQQDNITYKVVLSNRYDNSYIEDMYMTTSKLLTTKLYLDLKIGTLNNSQGIYKKTSINNPSIYPPQGVYNYNTQNSLLEYSTGINVGITYVTDSFNTVSIKGLISKQRNLSDYWASYSAFGFISPYSTVEADGRDVKGVSVNYTNNETNIQTFASYFTSTLSIVPKQRLSKTKQYQIFIASKNTATFLIEGDYAYSVYRYGFCLERPSYAIGGEYYLLDINNKQTSALDSVSEGYYVYLRYYINDIGLIPYVIYTQAHKINEHYSKDTTIGIKYMAIQNTSIAVELHDTSSDSWLEAKYPTNESINNANNTINFNSVMFNITYIF